MSRASLGVLFLPIDDDGLGWRIRQAMLDYARRIGVRSVNQAVFGAAVALEEGRMAPYTGASVSEWLSGKAEPSRPTLRAIADLAGRPREWVAWGSGPEWPGLTPTPARVAEHPPTAYAPKVPVPTPAERKAAAGKGNRRKRGGGAR